MKIKITIAVLLTIGALSFRLLLALRFPNDWPGDAVTYALLAKNLLHQHIYSSSTQEPLQPTYFRVPGYPLFLLAVYAGFGEDNQRAVRVIQAIADTITCWLIAALAFAWSPPAWELEKRRRARLIALALAACCPFTAIYVAVLLTEVWVNLFIMGCALAATHAVQAEKQSRFLVWWLVAGVAAGVATMFRPDAGFFAAGVGVWFALLGLRQVYRQRQKEKIARSISLADDPETGDKPAADALLPAIAYAPENPTPKGRLLSLTWRAGVARLVTGATIFSFGFVLVLAPWTIRNARVFGVFQPLAPASASMPGEWIPKGYNDWLRTWVDRESYTETVDWPLGTQPISIKRMPNYAFDSPEEKARVASLLDQYNHPVQESSTGAASEPAPAKDEETVDQGRTNDPQESAASDDDNSPDETQTDDDDGGDQEANDVAQGPVKMTPEIDAEFADIARQRRISHPFRYYVLTPVRRARFLWFSTHSGFYPFTGELSDQFDKQLHQEFWLPLFFGLLCLYTLLLVAGFLVLWKHGATRRWLLLFTLLTVPRFAYLTTLQNPESRYVVEFFPFVLAIAALALAAIRFRRGKEGHLVS